MMRLAPDQRVADGDYAHAERHLVMDAAWASTVGALSGGVVLVGFALELGASPFAIGLLAAIPLLAQAAQIPAIALVERLRQRRKITVIGATAARMLILAMALLPLIADPHDRLTALLCMQLAISALGATAGCALNSWLHQLLANREIGTLFARRLFWSTVLGAVGALAAGQLIDYSPFGDRLLAYALSFALAGVAGFIGVLHLARVPEPAMHGAVPTATIASMLRAPFRDAGFRSVIAFMASWNIASNIAAPFVTVYLLSQLGYGIGTVTILGVTSQAANALTIYSWGRLSDRLSNKAILATALPVYFGCLISLPFSTLPALQGMALPLLFAVHAVMGAASGGIGLATGNMGLKLAPQGQGTAYLASVSIVGSLAGGLAPIAGGALADWFASRKLAFQVQWTSPSANSEVTLMQFQHWEFMFMIAFVGGLGVLHLLSRIREGREISERVVIQQFIIEALRTFEPLSSVGGPLSAVLSPFGRLLDRRRRSQVPGDGVERRGVQPATADPAMASAAAASPAAASPAAGSHAGGSRGADPPPEPDTPSR